MDISKRCKQRKSLMTKPDRDVVITRVFTAPRELVYAAFTDAAHLKQWYGPHGFSIPVCESDPRPGGKLALQMRHDAADGALYPMTGTYGAIDPPQRFELFSQALAPDGSVALDIQAVYSFVDLSGKTELTIDIHILRATTLGEQYLAGMNEGWNQSLDKLATYFETVMR
jgi:uncharacterized protein YndB with AHSA1/START domain